MVEVDALRGFALLGILVVNLMTTAGPPGARGGLAGVHAADGAVEWAVVLLAQSKFYLLFSFLFGYSFTLQMDSAARAGRASRPGCHGGWPDCSCSEPHTRCCCTPATSS